MNNPYRNNPLCIFGFALVTLVVTVYIYGEAASAWIMPGLIFGMVLLGVVRKVPVYESFVSGAKEGFSLGIMIIPYLVAILFAIGMFRKSGGLDIIVGWVSPIIEPIGLPGPKCPWPCSVL